MTEDKNKYILSINGMSKSFGRNKVLKHISMNVKPGTIMGLMGENGAGKSTMMKCLFGTYQKDEGTIVLDGKEVNFSGPKDALENGVAKVHQELNQCLERSVVDNMFLGRYPKNSLGVVDEGRMKKETSDLFRKLGITVDLTQPMKKMSVSQRQMCEIAKAISYHSKVIVLDEPTSSLTAPEVEKLFKMMRQLKAQGISLIYISHKMDEIFEICDEISVLRDGSLVMTKASTETDMNELIAAMVGRSLDNRFPPVTIHREKLFSPYKIYQQNMHQNCRTFLLISEKEKSLDFMVWLVPVVPSFWRRSSEFVQKQKERSCMTEN